MHSEVKCLSKIFYKSTVQTYLDHIFSERSLKVPLITTIKRTGHIYNAEKNSVQNKKTKNYMYFEHISPLLLNGSGHFHNLMYFPQNTTLVKLT